MFCLTTRDVLCGRDVFFFCPSEVNGKRSLYKKRHGKDKKFIPSPLRDGRAANVLPTVQNTSRSYCMETCHHTLEIHVRFTISCDLRANPFPSFCFRPSRVHHNIVSSFPDSFCVCIYMYNLVYKMLTADV